MMIAAAIVLVFFLLVALPRLRIERLVGAVEAKLERFSRHKKTALWTLFLGAVAIRLAVLPLLSVPIPGIHDEYSYLLMADTFAHGRLANPPHPMWRSFETFHVNWFPTYSSMYPPAQGLALAIGELLGLPWIGVLLTAAGMAAVVFWMLCAWMPSRWAFLGGALVVLKLAIASYWMNSYWGGAVAAIGGAVVLGALPRIFRYGRVRDALLLGLGIAILANSRPYEGLFFCLVPAAVFLLWLTGKKRSNVPAARRWRSVFFPVACVFVLTLIFMGYYNWRLTGDAFLFPHNSNWRTYDTAPHFLWQQARPEKHYNNARFEEFYNDWERNEYHRSWSDALDVSWTKTKRLASTFLWWGLILAVPGVYFALGKRKRLLLWVSFGVLLPAVYAITFSNPHYAAPAACLLFALIVESLRHLRAMKWRSLFWGRALARASVVLLVLDTGAHVVQRECDPMDWTCPRDYGRAGIEKQLEALPGKHLVMVRYHEDDLSIHDEWVYNGADIDSQKVIWARELDQAQNQKLFAYYKSREIWLASTNGDHAYVVPYAPPEE